MNIFRLAGDMTHLLSIMVLTAENPCHAILQRYLPFKKDWTTAVQLCYLFEVQFNCCALCCQMSGKHRCCRESFLSDLLGRLH